jgi:anti-anti-sigma regulatory factor
VKPFSTAIGTDGRTLIVSGSIDEDAIDEFRSVLRRHVTMARDAAIDLSDVEFLPSMAVGALVGAMKHASGDLTIVARDGCFAAKVLTICGIPFEPQVTDATAPHESAGSSP